jgi:predicted RNA-binding Zn-ribbon protein involved in translation (DUF1610 family)
LRYCTNCGYELPETQTFGSICPQCGAQNGQEVRYCGSCGQLLLSGARIVPRTKTSVSSYSPEQKHSNWTRSFLLGTLLVLIIGGVIYGISVNLSHNFEVTVSSTGCWTGSLGTDGGQTSVQGCRQNTWSLSGRTIGAVFQMSGPGYTIFLTIAKDGATCAQQNSAADYGVVSAGC